MAKRKNVKPVPFPETNGGVPFNASGVVRTGSRRFAFVDNKDSTAVFEMTFDAHGETVERIHRRRLAGADGPGDPEGLALAESGGETFLVVSSSLSVADTGRRQRINDGLVRVRYRPDGDLPAEAMAGFREWLLAHVPSLAEVGRLEPDAGGLNVEGLAWDAHAGALLFGLRGPAVPGRVALIHIPVDVSGKWTTESLGPPTLLSAEVPRAAAPQGIRDVSWDARTGEFLVLLGRSASHGDAPFRLATWTQGDETVRPLDVSFHRTAKPEGVTAFSLGDERRILIVDDGGGYAVL